jgi:hypothetical protein
MYSLRISVNTLASEWIIGAVKELRKITNCGFAVGKEIIQTKAGADSFVVLVEESLAPEILAISWASGEYVNIHSCIKVNPPIADYNFCE